MEEFKVVTIKHIYRETNHCADALTNDVPILVGDLYIYPCIPNCIASLAYTDLIGVKYPGLLSLF